MSLVVTRPQAHYVKSQIFDRESLDAVLRIRKLLLLETFPQLVEMSHLC